MKKILTYISTALILVLGFVSCDEDETTYKALQFPQDSYIAFDMFSDGVKEQATEPIEIVVTYAHSSNETEPVSLGFTITSDTATEGVHYEIVDGKSTLDFGNGVYTDMIKILPIDNIIDEADDNKITITLNDTSVNTGVPGPDALGKSMVLTLIDDDCQKEDDLRPYEGTWMGDDNCGGATDITVETILPCGTGITIKGLGYSWLQGSYWDEKVVEEHDVFIDIDYANGTVSIAEQAYVTTTWNGDVQPIYNLVGEGTIDISGPSPVMHIEYDLLQPDGGGSMANNYAGSTCGSFYVADITLQ